MPKYGKPAIASWGPDRLDVFFKSKQGTLVHAWIADGSEGSYDLGGSLESDPVAVARGVGVLDVFARGTYLELLHWSWLSGSNRMSGPATLEGYLATNPVAVASEPDKLYVFAMSVDGPLRFWESTRDALGNETWSGPQVHTRPFMGFDPAVVQTSPGDIAVLINSGGVLSYLQLHRGVWEPGVNLGGQLSSAPVVMSRLLTGLPNWYDPLRIDVHARDDNRILKHWGRGLLGTWFKNEATPGIPEPLDADPIVVARAGEDSDMFVRTASGALRHWHWDASHRLWVGGEGILEGLNSHPAAVSRSPTRLDVVAQSDDTTLLRWWQDGSERGQRRWTIEAIVPDPVPQPTIGEDDAPINPHFLIARPADHTLLGFSAPGHRVSEGNPPRLVAEGTNAGLTLTFPPQHIAEEVSRPGATPPTTAAGVTYWRALQAAPSHVGFPATPGSPVALTSESVLAALRGARVLADADRTAVELPYGLITSPCDSATAESAVARHAAIPLHSEGNTGLWRMRLGNAVGDGGLALASPRAIRSDAFPMALTRANRSHIALQGPARADRMELSSLGGSLTASGRWYTLEWDHQAALGRDQYVRTATKGVLYPLGHRAVFVEVSERSADEPVAAVRKTRSLYVTEPIRQRDASGRLRKAFPFHAVEITTLEYNGLDEPERREVATGGWGKIPIPTSRISDLETWRDWVGNQMEQLREILGDMGYGGVGPVMEDLAMEEDPEEDPEEESQALPSSARKYISLYCTVEDIIKYIAVLKEGGLDEELVEVFFMPHIGGKPIRFPVRCAAANRDVHFDLPLVFVADIKTGPGTHQSFDSLSDTRVDEMVKRTYRAAAGGIVELPGTPINITPSADGTVAPCDVQEVHRINILGHQSAAGSAAGFAPSLGGLNGEEWAAEIGVPTLRSLCGGEPRTEVRLDEAYLASGVGDVADVALRVVPRVGAGEPQYLNIDFSARSDRSGGLIAPNSVADGISRVKGLVNVAGLQPPEGSVDLDPAKLFSNGASLFGFPLWDLVKDIKVPPEVVTILAEGQPPTVRMMWEDIVLKELARGAFKPREPLNGVPSRLTLSVESSPTSNESTCTLTNFMLVMPPGEPLIEVFFDSVAFTQKTGQPPNLSMSGLNANLVGKLKLLKILQDGVGLGNLGPKIETNPTDITARFAVPIPDVAAFAFVMSNLTFGAALRVPFNGDPVSLALGFASRERPFTLTVLMFGGGGYVDVELIHTGPRRLEISLQFGAALAINFGIGQAEVHAFGGIRYALLPSGGVVLTGFIHIGGSVELLGLISVSVELRVELDYQFDSNRLVGQATLVIEIDITLFSELVELDSGEWVIAGGAAERSLPPPGPTISRAEMAPRDVERAAEAWRRYREAFA